MPILVSSHSGHDDQIRWLAGALDTLDGEMRHHLTMAGITRPTTTVPLVVTPAMDDAPEMAHVLARRTRALSDGSGHQAIFLVGHGPNSEADYAAWMENFRVIADSVRRLTGAPSVLADVVRDDADAPVRAEAVRRIRNVIGLQAQVTGKPVIVVPILVAHGAIGDDKFRHDLAGLSITYSAEPLLPDAEMARWVERRVREASRAGVD